MGSKNRKVKFDKGNIKVTCFTTGEVVEGYDKYLQTRHWKQLREQVAEIAGYTCAFCGGFFKDDFEIHHNTYKRLGNEKLSDLGFYCKKCHKKIHNSKDDWQIFRKQYSTQITSKISNLNEEQIDKVMQYIDELLKENQPERVWRSRNGISQLVTYEVAMQMDVEKAALKARKKNEKQKIIHNKEIAKADENT